MAIKRSKQPPGKTGEQLRQESLDHIKTCNQTYDSMLPEMRRMKAKQDADAKEFKAKMKAIEDSRDYVICHCIDCHSPVKKLKTRYTVDSKVVCCACSYSL